MEISYLSNGERMIFCGNDWIVLHPEDGEIVASSNDMSTAIDLIGYYELLSAWGMQQKLTRKHLTPGMRDSILIAWNIRL